MAVFRGLTADTKYQVTELGAYLNGYTVYIDGTEHQVISDPSSGQSVPSAQTGILTVGEDKDVVFRNEIRDRATLSVTKRLAAGTENTTEPFNIKVKIQGQVYTGGYRVYENGVQQGDVQYATSGYISIKAGQIAKINDLPYGANVEVTEQTNGSYKPTYEIKGCYDTKVPEIDADGNSNGVISASGKIQEESAEVIVTNTKVNIEAGSTTVTIKKNWDESEKYSDLIPDSIKVTLYEDVDRDGKFTEGKDIKVTQDANGNPITAEVELKKNDGWTHQWINLKPDTDYVVREVYPEGFIWKSTSYTNTLSDLVYVDRVTTCKNTSINIGKNNIVFVKPTTQDYYLWTAYDLKLDSTSNEFKTLAQNIKGLKLEGAGSYKPDTLTYQSGQTGYQGITITPTEDGWNLEFDDTSVWSQIWILRYKRTENINLTNTIDAIDKIDITVNKEWEGIDDSYLPENITIELLQDGNKYNEAVISKDANGKWSHTFKELPCFKYDESSNTYSRYEYTVVETKIGDLSPSEAGYEVTYSELTNNTITITNKLAKDWKIYKRSINDPEGNNASQMAGAILDRKSVV